MIVAAVLALVSVAGADPPDAITVTADRLPERHARAVAFVRATGVAGGDRPAARWLDPVCPRAVGLAPRHAGPVEAQLRRIATDAGITVASAPCRANIVVTFVHDAGGVVAAIAARSPRQLAEVDGAARAALLTGAAPVRWWYATEARDRDGMPASALPPPGSFGNSEGGGSVIPMGDTVTSVQHFSASRVGTGTVRALRAATVVVDVDRSDGRPLTAVVAYAGLVAFAEIRASATPPPDSILARLAAPDPPRDLTPWDRGFLRALYRLPLDRDAGRQRQLLVRALVAATTPD